MRLRTAVPLCWCAAAAFQRRAGLAPLRDAARALCRYTRIPSDRSAGAPLRRTSGAPPCWASAAAAPRCAAGELSRVCAVLFRWSGGFLGRRCCGLALSRLPGLLYCRWRGQLACRSPSLAEKRFENFTAQRFDGRVGDMLISIWSDKGGTAKTTTSVIMASYFEAKLFDLDRQRDLCRWAEKAQRACEWLRIYDDNGRFDQAASLATQARLLEAAQSEDLYIVDCPPGTEAERMMGMVFSRLVIVPTRDGDSDLVALARALEAVAQVQRNGNPDLQVAVILTAARDTSRSRGVAQGLGISSGYTYLGALKQRNQYVEAYSRGQGVVGEGGPAAEEAEAAMRKLVQVLPELARWVAPARAARAA